MGGIKVPLATNDQGELVDISEATKDKNYCCPSCRTPLIVRKGEIKVHHFAHKTCNFCSQETVIHKTAKLLLYNMVKDWKEGQTQAPIINRQCQICYKKIPQPLPNKVQSAELEIKLANGLIMDVALMGSERVLAGIEVKVTHEVNSEKAELMPIPFIEIDGYKFVENPKEINVIQDKFNPITCNDCKQKLIKYISRAEKISKLSNIELPSSFYRYGICRCWKCKKEILVFTWPGHSNFTIDEPQVEPKPPSIKFKYSNTIKSKYWVNCCPYCNSIQGDFFLYNQSGNPFFGLFVGEDNKIEFHHDMLTIAYLSDYY